MTHSISPNERLGFLDLAGGLAALLVLVEHGLGVCLPNLLNDTVGTGTLGKTGVILFLLISGFIIPASLEQGGSNARFWLRRFFRLFPAYWVSIAVAFLSCWPSGQFTSVCPKVTPGDWLLNLTMVQGFFGRPSVWGVFWTLQLELTIYAACSLLVTARLHRRLIPLAFGVLAAFALVGLGRPWFEGKPFGLGGSRFFYFAPLVGFLAQRYHAGRIGRGTLWAWGLAKVWVLTAIWAVNHALFPAKMTSACLEEMVRTYGAAYAFFFLLLAARHRPLSPGVCWLGRISYSVYLLHPFVISVLAPAHWPAWAFLPAYLTGTLVLAALAYRFVELPGIAMGRALERYLWPLPRQPQVNSSLSRRAA